MRRLERAGTITGLHRYRVKSMAGEALSAVCVTQKAGVDNDRQYAFQQRKPDSRRGFPWFTARDNPEMVLYRPFMDGRQLVVATPDESVPPIESVQLATDLRDGSRKKPEIHLTHLGRGAWDGFPISIMGEDTVAAVAKRSGLPDSEQLDARRYRPNVVAATNPPVEGAEDEWVGKILQFGDSERSPILYTARPDERCTFITINPDDAKIQKAVHMDVATTRNNEMGVYAMVLREGIMELGKPIYFVNL